MSGSWESASILQSQNTRLHLSYIAIVIVGKGYLQAVVALASYKINTLQIAGFSLELLLAHTISNISALQEEISYLLVFCHIPGPKHIMREERMLTRPCNKREPTHKLLKTPDPQRRLVALNLGLPTTVSNPAISKFQHALHMGADLLVHKKFKDAVR
jgi:hypothetical protein